MSKRDMEQANLSATEEQPKEKVPKVEEGSKEPPAADDYAEAEQLLQNIDASSSTARNVPPTAPRTHRQYHKSKVEQVEVFVGGKRFKTTRETLTSVPGSLLAELFTRDGPKEAKKNENNAYEIPDRSGDHFMYILNYLRDREIDAPTNKQVFSEIETEAKYYGLNELVKLLHDGAGSSPLESSSEGTSTGVQIERKEFDSKDFVTVTPILSPGAKAAQTLTITLFIEITKKPKKGQALATIFHKGASESEVAGSLMLNDQRQLVLCLSDDLQAKDHLVSQASIDLKTAVHIGIVLEKDTCSLFLDDIKDSSVPLVGTTVRDALLSDDRPFRVGGSDSFSKGKSGIAGSVWALRIHHKALSQEELAKDRTENEKSAK